MKLIRILSRLRSQARSGMISQETLIPSNRILTANHFSTPPPGHTTYFPNKIGTREVVGFGMNGQPTYIDSVLFPYPAVRFREITPEYKALKEKEKGSWRILTLNEKKCLYRISFCKTIAEVDAPTGEWKKILGSTLIILSCALWFHLFIIFMTRGELPESFKTENQLAQLKRMIDLRMNPIEGISSKWDYDSNNWKGKGSRTTSKKKNEDE